MKNEIQLDRFCKKLNYIFIKKNLLIQALTHRSVGQHNNERLEFLGDSLLNMIISEALYDRFPEENEGQLSRLRAYLVKGETLGHIASELNLGECLHLGQGELKSGGFRRTSILADALEAVIAAIFLDAGFDACKTVVEKLYEKKLHDHELQSSLKDCKTQLQEYVQSKKYTLPQYTLIKTTGEDHEQIFHVSCQLKELKLTAEGHGDSRRKAEQNAAAILLKQIKK